MLNVVMNWPRKVRPSVTRRSALAYGSGRSRTALTTEKIAVLAAIEIASVSTAAMATAGLRASDRTAWRKSEASGGTTIW